MGMFDSVMAKCPDCGELVEFQSKAGHCDLVEYKTYEVPTEIAIDICGDEVACKGCGTIVKLITPAQCKHVSMIVERG